MTGVAIVIPMLNEAAGLPRDRASFDHLVRASEERQRYRQSERLGGLEINDKLEFHCLLDREIGPVWHL